MATVFHTTRRVDFSDTDMAGIVHFANFFRYMEAAEQAFLRSRGLSAAQLEWEGQVLEFPRVSASCDYLRPARFEDVLDVAVRVQAIGRKSVTYGFEFTRDGELLARGQISAVCCRVFPAEHRVESIDIPDGIRRQLLGGEPGA